MTPKLNHALDSLRYLISHASVRRISAPVETRYRSRPPCPVCGAYPDVDYEAKGTVWWRCDGDALSHPVKVWHTRPENWAKPS